MLSTKKWPRGQLQRVALIWAGLFKAVLSTQACPQSVWEKAEAE